MRTRWLLPLPFVLALVGCTARPADAPTRPAPALQDVVVLGTSHGTDVVDTGTGDVLATEAGRITAPDGSRLYAVRRSGGSTELRALDSATGKLLSSITLDGSLDARVASLSGDAVALMRPLPTGLEPTTTLALPRSRSTIVVADPSGERTSRRYDLRGNYEPEAFSVDDTRLFLIQYLPAEAPRVYRVTVLDLRRGTVRGVFGRFKTPPERMPGVRLEQVYDPASEQLYTLYTNRVDGTYEGDWKGAEYGSAGGEGQEVSFVHVLNLRDGWAYCAGLPRKLWGQPAGAQAMAVSPDGRSLYVVDPMRSAVVEMNTRSLRIARRVSVDLGSLGDGPISALMSADGHTLFVGSARPGAPIAALDVDTLRVLARWTMPSGVTAFGMSSDGARLYAALGDQVRIVDPTSGDELGELRVDGVDAILHVFTPVG